MGFFFFLSFQAFQNYFSNYPSVEAWVYTGVSLFPHHISQHDPSIPPGSPIFQSHRMLCPSHTDGIYLCWKLVIVYLKFKLDWRHSIFITPSGNPTQITLRAFRPACHCHTTPSLRLHSTSPLTLANLAFKDHLKCPFLCKIFPIFLRQFRSSCNIFTSVYERLAIVNWLLVFPFTFWYFTLHCQF